MDMFWNGPGLPHYPGSIARDLEGACLIVLTTDEICLVSVSRVYGVN